MNSASQARMKELLQWISFSNLIQDVVVFATLTLLHYRMKKRGEIPELRIFSMHWYYAVNFSFYLTWLRYDVYSLHKCSFYGKDTTYLNIVTQLNKLEFQ